MNPVAIDLGFVQIYWYSITMLLAILVGSFILYKGLKGKDFQDETIVDMIFYTIICGIVGARIYFVIFNLDYYLAYPIEILEVWNGGLAIHGAIIGGLIFLYFYTRKHKINLLRITDSAAIAIIIAQAIGRWGNFFNGEAHGNATTLANLQKSLVPNFVIKGMYMDGVYYIPTFYYEFWWNLIGFIVLVLIKRYVKTLKTGQLTGAYFIWYSFGRFFIERLRTDSLMLGSIRIAQLISVLLFIIGIILVFYPRKKTRINKLKEKGELNEN